MSNLPRRPSPLQHSVDELVTRRSRQYALRRMNAAHPQRRSLMVGAALAPWVGDVHAQPGRKRLRVSLNSPEAGFDPARHGDLYSSTVQAHIFEPLFTYDPLASPPKLIPLTAAGPAEHEDNFRTWTIRLQPGIYFDEHPACA
jgi:ABC-type transport system substrate-binding protein